jgi:hypothetical protein
MARLRRQLRSRAVRPKTRSASLASGLREMPAPEHDDQTGDSRDERHDRRDPHQPHDSRRARLRLIDSLKRPIK